MRRKRPAQKMMMVPAPRKYQKPPRRFNARSFASKTIGAVAPFAMLALVYWGFVQWAKSAEARPETEPTPEFALYAESTQKQDILHTKRTATPQPWPTMTPTPVPGFEKTAMVLQAQAAEIDAAYAALDRERESYWNEVHAQETAAANVATQTEIAHQGRMKDADYDERQISLDSQRTMNAIEAGIMATAAYHEDQKCQEGVAQYQMELVGRRWIGWVSNAMWSFLALFAAVGLLAFVIVWTVKRMKEERDATVEDQITRRQAEIDDLKDRQETGKRLAINEELFRFVSDCLEIVDDDAVKIPSAGQMADIGYGAQKWQDRIDGLKADNYIFTATGKGTFLKVGNLGHLYQELRDGIYPLPTTQARVSHHGIVSGIQNTKNAQEYPNFTYTEVKP